MGDRYGPKIVARGDFKIRDLKKSKLAIPGTTTTAYLVARLALGDFEFEIVPSTRFQSWCRRAEF